MPQDKFASGPLPFSTAGTNSRAKDQVLPRVVAISNSCRSRQVKPVYPATPAAGGLSSSSTHVIDKDGRAKEPCLQTRGLTSCGAWHASGAGCLAPRLVWKPQRIEQAEKVVVVVVFFTILDSL